MNIKAELDMVLGALQAVLHLVEKVDPNAASNPVVVEVEKVIAILKSIGL